MQDMRQQQATSGDTAVAAWLARRLSDFKQRNNIPDGVDIEQTIANEVSPNMARVARAVKMRSELRDIQKALGVRGSG